MSGIDDAAAPPARYQHRARAVEKYRGIEDAAISIRRSRTSVKLPDALIIATARVHHVRLVTLDHNLEKLGMWLDATVR